MRRLNIQLTDEQVEALTVIHEADGASYAETVRRAVALYVELWRRRQGETSGEATGASNRKGK